MVHCTEGCSEGAPSAGYFRRDASGCIVAGASVQAGVACKVGCEGTWCPG